MLSLFHCCVILPYKDNRTRKICQRTTGCTIQVSPFFFFFFFFLLKEDETKRKCSRIINHLFGVLVHNTRGHFTHYSHFSSPLRCSETSTTQLVKYPLVQSTKTPNKVYLLNQSQYWLNICCLVVTGISLTFAFAFVAFFLKKRFGKHI